MDRESTTTECGTSEERFLEYARHDNAAALEIVLRDHLDQAYTLARRILGNYADAEDAVQEALARLIKTAPTYTGAIPFGAWLGQLVLRASVEVRRARGRRQARERVAGAEHGPPLDQPDSEEMDLLRRVVQSLPVRYREPIELHYFGGLSQEETGRALGLKEKAVAQRLHRARKHIRDKLNREGVGAAVMPFLLRLRSHLEKAPAQLLEKSASGAHLLAHAASATGASWWGLGLMSAIAGALAISGIGLHLQGSRQATPRGAANSADAAGHSSATHPATASSTLPSVDKAHIRDLRWTFDQPGDLQGLQLLKGAWHHQSSGGIGNSGYMQIDSTDFSMSIDLSTLHLPLLLTCQIAVSGESYSTAQWLERQQDTTGQFIGLGKFEVGVIGWLPLQIYIDEHDIDHWEAGHRYGLLAIRRIGESPLKLVGRRMQGLDDLHIQEISREQEPDVHGMMDFFDHIPLAQRHGRRAVPAGTLAPNAVSIEFPDALPPTNP